MVKKLCRFFVATVVVCLLQPTSIKTMAQPENPIFCAIKNSDHDLFDRLLKAGATIHDHNKQGDSCIVAAVKARNFYALRRLFKIGADVNALVGTGTILKLALTQDYSTCDKNPRIVQATKRALVTIILGQQPADLTGLTNQEAYRDLIMATTEPLLKKQIDLLTSNSKTLVTNRLIPLITYGTSWQFMYTAQALQKQNGKISPEALFDSCILQSQKNIKGSWNSDTVLASLCIMALRQHACLSFFRLLSLCAQRGIVSQKRLSGLELGFEACPWVHDMPYLHEALEPIRVQEQLNKIRGKNNKSTGQLKDITIRFKNF